MIIDSDSLSFFLLFNETKTVRAEEIIGGESDLSHRSEQAGWDASGDWPAHSVSLSHSLPLSLRMAQQVALVSHARHNRQGPADTSNRIRGSSVERKGRETRNMSLKTGVRN